MTCTYDESGNITTTGCDVTLFQMNPTLGVIYVIVSAINMVTGLAGNALIIKFTLFKRKVNEFAKYFILNNAIADFCVAGIANPMCIAGALLGMNYFEKHFWLCSIMACLCLSTCICVFFNITALAVNRFVFICHNSFYRKFYNKASTIAICISCWVIAIGAEFPNFIGWGGHYFDQKSHQCIWDRTADRSYTLFITVGLMIPAFAVTGVCNAMILNRISVSTKAIGKFSVADRRTFLKSQSSARTILGLFITYVVCWTPYIIVLLLDSTDSMAMEVHLLVTLLAHTHSSIPFFVYTAINKKFRSEIYSLVQTKTPSQIHPIPSVPYDTPRPATLNDTTYTDVSKWSPFLSRQKLAPPPELSNTEVSIA